MVFCAEDVKKHLPQMTDQLTQLVACPTVRGTAEEGYPFGREVARCLDIALGFGRQMGYQVKNMDNYCGYIQMGQGEQIIGIAAHLDVVPPGDGWATNPYTLTRQGNTLYGRGVSDDKGAAVAALWAMELVRQAGLPLNRRVRLILGCAEETGSECMAHYAASEGGVWAGFTPDGNFPGIHGEKGGCALTFFAKKTKIIQAEGGFVTNAVCPQCTVVVPADAVDQNALRQALQNTPLTSFELSSGDNQITIEAHGTAAHAASPTLGVNAIGCTMQALQDAGVQDDFVQFYNRCIGTDCTGVGLGIAGQDAYGPLTLCNGTITTKEGQISGTLDIRYPVTWNSNLLQDKLQPALDQPDGSVQINSIGEPLFYPANSPLVTALARAYATVTGDTKAKPMVIGGGTYAKSLPGIIAFGCEFPGTDNHIHDVNERLDIDEWCQQVAIYATAIANLLQQK